MQRVKALLVGLTIILLLSGCGKLGVTSSTNISEKGAGVFSFKVSYDDFISKNIKGSILKDNKNATAGERIRKYADEQGYVEEYKINFNSLDDLNKKLVKNENGFQVNVIKKTGLFKDTYTYEMKILKAFTPAVIKSRFLENNNDEQFITTYSNNIIDEFLSKVEYTNKVILPGKIISTNAVESNGNSLVWTYYLGQINSETSMTATYIIDKNSNIVLTVVVGLILVILIIAYVIRYRRRIS